MFYRENITMFIKLRFSFGKCTTREGVFEPTTGIDRLLEI